MDICTDSAGLVSIFLRSSAIHFLPRRKHRVWGLCLERPFCNLGFGPLLLVSWF